MTLSNNAKNVVQRSLRRFGWEIHRFSDPSVQALITQLAHRKLETVLDVGANEGQFASSLITEGFTGNIISFEPLSGPHAKLVRRALAHKPWEVRPRAAVGSTNGIIEINVSENSVSSSILPILKQHTSAAPRSAYVGRETVPMTTLDSFAADRQLDAPFLKVDTQGYELEVLKGAKGLLASVGGLLLEISTAPLYDGQPSYLALIQHVLDNGFALWSIEPGFTDRDTGKLLQFDAVFFRT